MSMSPVEEFAEARRSGKYDTDWPDKPEHIAAHNPTDPQSHNPTDQQTEWEPLENHSYICEESWKKNRIKAKSSEKKKPYDVVLGIIFGVWLLILSIVVFVHIQEKHHHSHKEKETSAAVKKAPAKIVYKTRYKTKKIKVVETPKDYRETKENLATAKATIARMMERDAEDTWRKKLCYGYGDWDACLAYRKNLPLRARVGREDLY